MENRKKSGWDGVHGRMRWVDRDLRIIRISLKKPGNDTGNGGIVDRVGYMGGCEEWDRMHQNIKPGIFTSATVSSLKKPAMVWTIEKQVDGVGGIRENEDGVGCMDEWDEWKGIYEITWILLKKPVSVIGNRDICGWGGLDGRITGILSKAINIWTRHFHFGNRCVLAQKACQRYEKLWHCGWSGLHGWEEWDWRY